MSCRKISDTSANVNRNHSPSPPRQPPSQGSYSQISRDATSLFSWTPPLLSTVKHGKPSYYYTAFCSDERSLNMIFRSQNIISLLEFITKFDQLEKVLNFIHKLRWKFLCFYAWNYSRLIYNCCDCLCILYAAKMKHLKFEWFKLFSTERDEYIQERAW